MQTPVAKPLAHGAFVLLGRAANGGKFWLATAGILGASRDRRHRRAALRGLLSAGIASAAANGMVKLMVRRRRPTLGRVLAHLPGYPSPSTSSFPSGHTATGFAFAAAVGQEVPALALPLLGLAGAIGYSRIRSGAHHASDVGAGIMLGLGAAWLARRAWPVERQEPDPRPHAPDQPALSTPASGLSSSPSNSSAVSS